MHGESFGRYRLFELIGQGGMGKVFKAHDTVIGRDVAIKVLPAELRATPGYEERFRREAHAARLTELHIIPIHDTGEINGQLYLVMPIIDGVDLQSVLGRDGPLTPSRAVGVIEQLGAALNVAAPDRACGPEERYQTAIELAAAARRALASTPASERPGPPVTDAVPPRAESETLAERRVSPEPTLAATDLRGVSAPTLAATGPVPGSPAAAPLSPPARRRARTKIVAIAAAILVVAAASVAGYLLTRPSTGRSPRSLGPPPSPPRAQIVLRIPGFVAPAGVALDGAGDLYIGEPDIGRPLVRKLAAGSSTPSDVPVADLISLSGLAVDGAGNVYVSDNLSGRVAMLAVGSNAQTLLPFSGVSQPDGVAVDGVGNVYVSDFKNNQVVELAAGSSTQTVLPFAGLSNPVGVAVNSRGDVFVSDSGNHRILELAARTTTQTELPFTGLVKPYGVAVKGAGDVYVVDYKANVVVELPAVSRTQTVLPFTGLSGPESVAVDAAGNVYVGDYLNNRVLKLPPG